MTSSVQIIYAVLYATLPEQQIKRLDVRQGGLRFWGETVEIAREALAKYNEPAGPGWLQEAGTPRIVLSGESGSCPSVDPNKAWPVAGERASLDGHRSIHLRRSPKGWELIHFVDDLSAKGILLTERFLSTDLTVFLVYHVAYTLQSIGGHSELRPSASRFIGFEPVENLYRLW